MNDIKAKIKALVESGEISEELANKILSDDEPEQDSTEDSEPEDSSDAEPEDNEDSEEDEEGAENAGDEEEGGKPTPDSSEPPSEEPEPQAGGSAENSPAETEPIPPSDPTPEAGQNATDSAMFQQFQETITGLTKRLESIESAIAALDMPAPNPNVGLPGVDSDITPETTNPILANAKRSFGL